MPYFKCQPKPQISSQRKLQDMEHGRYSKWGENIKAALLYSGEENSQAQKIHAAMQFSKRGTDTTYVVVYNSICTLLSVCG